MNDNTPFEIHPDEHLAARITAYALGEASAFEAAEIEALIEKSPELQLFLKRIRILNDLVREAETTANQPNAEWQLSEEKRAKLEPILGSIPVLIPQRKNNIRRASFRAAIGIAAALAITAFLARFIYIPPSYQMESPTIVSYSASLNEEVEMIGKKSNEKIQKKPSAPSNQSSKAIAANTANPVRIPIPEVNVGKPASDFGDADHFGSGWAGGTDESLGKNERRSRSEASDFISPEGGVTIPGIPTEGELAENITSGLRSGDSAINRNDIDAILNNPNRTAGDKPASELADASADTSVDPFADTSGLTGGRSLQARPPADSFSDAEQDQEEILSRTNAAKSMELSDQVDDVRRTLYKAQGNYDLGKYDDAKKDYENTLRIDPYNTAALRGMEKIAMAKSDYYRAAYDHTRAELLMKVDKDWELSVPAEPERTADFSPPPNLTDLSEEIPAAQEPFSTFSLNISDASFQVARSAIEKGERPDPTTIKPEQFYNAVDYGDPAPSSLEPVSATIDQAAHPVIPGRNLVRIAVRTASTGRSAAQPLRLTLLVDQSGSMVRADRRAAMDTALAQLATLLTENDQITVIGFSRTPHLLADSISGTSAATLPDLINQTANEGGTNLEEAINLASELALRHRLEGAQNRIVLFTDGAANLGNADPDRLAEKVKSLRQEGLAFDIAGIGTDDVNDRLLSELARHGNGRYYLVGENTAGSLAKQLAGAFRPAAENVKVQVKLNPERVGSYKLIGFEKDRLKTEDFRNDSVDAAELAADEAGVAIYQVETLPQGDGEIGEVSVRFRNAASGEMVERSWTVPYEATAPAFDRADPKTQLAGLSLLAAQKLQGGPLADAINFRDLAPTIAKVKQAYEKSEKAQQMIRLIDALK